jgi:hypothetical protein
MCANCACGACVDWASLSAPTLTSTTPFTHTHTHTAQCLLAGPTFGAMFISGQKAAHVALAVSGNLQAYRLATETGKGGSCGWDAETTTCSASPHHITVLPSLTTTTTTTTPALGLNPICQLPVLRSHTTPPAMLLRLCAQALRRRRAAAAKKAATPAAEALTV